MTKRKEPASCRGKGIPGFLKKMGTNKKKIKCELFSDLGNEPEREIMGIDLSRFKVVHGDKILNAVALVDIRMPNGMNWENRETIVKPNVIDVLAINEDGNLVSIMDEAWTFQFLPIISN